jgi:uncharacterized membrane protein
MRIQAMAKSANLWAIGYDDLHGADRLRNVITNLAAPVQQLLLLDLAVLTRNADGSYALDRKPFPGAGNIFEGGPIHFLLGIAMAAPLLTSRAVGEMLGLAGMSVSKAVGIDDKFVMEIQTMMKPRTSALLMLDTVGDLEAALEGLKGLGGTVLKTNVDLERAKLIESTLRAEGVESGKIDKPAAQ